MDIGMLAICIGAIVAGYNLFSNLRRNKGRKEQGNRYIVKTLGKSLLLGLLAYIVVINIDFATEESAPPVYETEESISVEHETVADAESEQKEAESIYTFRNDQLLKEHYEKHGIYMKYKSPEKYVKGANRVIADEETLHAIEAEDGDDVYYLEKTNEFVVVSKDGYIRTYFCPEDGIEYFHGQFE